MRKKTVLLLAVCLLAAVLLAVCVRTFLWFPVRPEAVRPVDLQRTEDAVSFGYLQLDSGYRLAGCRFRVEGNCLVVRFYGSLLPFRALGGACRWEGDAAAITEIRFTDGRDSVTVWQQAE